MKSFLLIALLAFSAVVALGAPARTSKPMALSDTQMKSVKGQAAFLYVYVWNYNGSGQFYTGHIMNQNIGYTGYNLQVVFAGGPNAGTYYMGYEAPPVNGQSSTANPWVTAFPPYDANGNFINPIIERITNP